MPWKGGKRPEDHIPRMLRRVIHQRAAQAMFVVIEQAVRDMKNFTATRPTPNSGKSGRVDTATMLESIAGDVFLAGADRIIGQFGFIDRQELYFALQTSTGFRHYISGNFIEPTFAMRDAAIIAIQNLISELKK